MNEIFVLMSFLIKDNGDIEEGCKYWFRSFERAVKYLNNAGHKTDNGYVYGQLPLPA